MNNIAIYLRISKEDNKNQESNSILNQRTLILNYIKNNEYLKDYTITEYIDDGFSALDFNRPKIQNLFEDMRNNKVNCIIVKDLSRFGRNYIEVVNYLENIFPFLNIRFIAINDNFDTNNSKYNLNSLDINFKNIINDYYCKDLSKKISSSKLVLAKQGKYLSKAPLGYDKCKENKYKLEINLDEAELVKLIFKSFLETKSCTEVVKILNKNNIVKSSINKFKNSNTKTWTPKQIKKILRNKIYIGTIEYLKTIKCGRKIRIKNNKENIISFENMHQPIISKEDFYSAQKIFKNKVICNTKNKKNIFAYKLYCGYCKYSMRKSNVRYICKMKSYKYLNECDLSIIEIDLLKDIVFTNIKKLVMELLSKNINNSIDDIKDIENNLKNLELEKNNNYILYLDKFITKEEYIKKKEYIEKEKILIELRYKNDEHKDINKLEDFKNKKSLTEEMVDTFIKRIYIYDKNRVEIEWNIDIFKQN